MNVVQGGLSTSSLMRLRRFGESERAANDVQVSASFRFVGVIACFVFVPIRVMLFLAPPPPFFFFVVPSNQRHLRRCVALFREPISYAIDDHVPRVRTANPVHCVERCVLLEFIVDC
jgi:hypothetical protein